MRVTQKHTDDIKREIRGEAAITQRAVVMVSREVAMVREEAGNA